MSHVIVLPKWLMDHLHWQHLLAKPLATATRDKNNPICVASPKVARESTMVTVVCCCLRHYRRCYSSKLRQCKHSFRCSTNPSVRTRTHIRRNYRYWCSDWCKVGEKVIKTLQIEFFNLFTTFKKRNMEWGSFKLYLHIQFQGTILN
jgi:hypothetical protein